MLQKLGESGTTIKKNHFFFLGGGFQNYSMFTKHCPSEILNLNFEKTVYLTAIFWFNMSLRVWKLKAPVLHTK